MSLTDQTPTTDVSAVAKQLLADAFAALPSCGGLAAPVRSFILIHQKALAFTSMVPVRIAEALSRNSEGIEATIEAAAERVHGSVAMVEQARAVARQDAANGLKNKVVQGLAPRAAALGEACAAAGQEVDDALVRTSLIFNGYAASAAPRDLVTLIAEGQLAEEIKAMGCVDLLRRVNARTALGDDAEVEKLIRVSTPFVIGTTRMPRAAIQKRLGANASADAATKEEEAAWRLKNIADQRRAEGVPPELEVVTNLRDSTLLAIFARVVGVAAWSQTDVQFRALLASNRVPSRWAVDPNFYTRGLDSSARWGGAQAIPGRTNMKGI